MAAMFFCVNPTYGVLPYSITILFCHMQVLWQELYSTKSSRDKCTLYQLRNLIDRRDVTAEPKGTLHACQSFLTVVVEAEVLAAFAVTNNLERLDVDGCEILPDGVPTTTAGKLECITQIAKKVLSCTCLQPVTPDHDNHSADSEPLFQSDDMSNYSSKLLTMGLLAWNFEDAIREGDGGRIISMWKFLLLFFKQSGKTKYSIEAAKLLADFYVNLSPEKRYELKWNCTSSSRGGLGNNKPLDLMLEHMNRTFTDNVRDFHAHLTEASVEKTSHAAPHVSQFVDQFDSETDVRKDSGYHVIPSFNTDRRIIFEELMKHKVVKHDLFRQYSLPTFAGIHSDPYYKIRQQSNWQKFQEWLCMYRSSMVMEQEYQAYLHSRRGQ